ncbi:MAG: hypothetical protein AB2535_18850 [Candidatus Thiodiazotropha endolucinida]
MKTEIMYIEDKEDLVGDGRICRVQLSKTGKTLYYHGMEFQSLKGVGYTSNYYELNSGIKYWISKPRKDGNDTLYPGVVKIDEDVQKEYWCNIRNQPENAQLSSYRCSGKYSRKKPHAELNVSGRSRNGGDRSAG